MAFLWPFSKVFFIFLSSCLLLVPSLFRLWPIRSKWGRSPPLCPNKASTNLCSGPPHQVLTVTPVQRKSKTPTRCQGILVELFLFFHQWILSSCKCMWHPSTSRKPCNLWSSLTCRSLFQITFCSTASYRRPWKSMRRIPAGNLWKEKNLQKVLGN